MTRLSEAIIEVRRASRALDRAQRQLGQLRGVQVGALSLNYSSPIRIPPAQLDEAIDVILHVEHRGQVNQAGVNFQQLLVVNGAIQIVAESRFYSNDFYRSAIAKFEGAHG